MKTAYAHIYVSILTVDNILISLAQKLNLNVIYRVPYNIILIPITKYQDFVKEANKYGYNVIIVEKDLEYVGKLVEKPTEVKLAPVYGEGKTSITKMKHGFIVKTSGGEYFIPKEDIRFIYWTILRLHKEGKETVKTREIAEHYCARKGLTEYFKNGKFQWEYFFGSRKHYIPFQLILRLLRDVYHAIDYGTRGIIKFVKPIRELEL